MWFRLLTPGLSLELVKRNKHWALALQRFFYLTIINNYFDDRNLSASMAAIHPVPAAVMAWR